MGGYREVRATGTEGEQFRLVCVLENAEADELGRRGLGAPALAVITGPPKPWRTLLCEPLRESCRLQSLRGWSHVKHIEEVLAGGS